MRTIKELKEERKKLREIARQATDNEIPMSNEVGGKRREHVITLLKIATVPDRRAVNIDILRTAIKLLQYNDRMVNLLLTCIVEEDYSEAIKYAKLNKNGNKKKLWKC